jgi:hypothetical protein
MRVGFRHSREADTGFKCYPRRYPESIITQHHHLKSLILLVSAEGLEPSTP